MRAYVGFTELPQKNTHHFGFWGPSNVIFLHVYAIHLLCAYFREQFATIYNFMYLR
jgi:hypothetical protein